MENPGEESGGIIGALPGITVTSYKGFVKVESTYTHPVTLPVYNVLGMVIMKHVALPGTTYLKLPEGVYIVHGQKFM